MRRTAAAETRAEREAPAEPISTGAAPRLYERAGQILAARIAEGTLAPGTRLLESHVAEQFGISRAPARQALALLAKRGLLTRASGHGYVVAPGPGRAQATLLRVTNSGSPISMRRPAGSESTDRWSRRSSPAPASIPGAWWRNTSPPSTA